MTGRKRHSLGGRDASLVVEVIVSVTTENMKREINTIYYLQVLSDWHGDESLIM